MTGYRAKTGALGPVLLLFLVLLPAARPANAEDDTGEWPAVEEAPAWLTAPPARDGTFAFVVTDSGIGIAPEEMDKAFAPFEQVDSRLSRQYEGTGLGLPLSLGLMKLHGGTLRLDSTPGNGTTARAVLPARRVLS